MIEDQVNDRITKAHLQTALEAVFARRGYEFHVRETFMPLGADPAQAAYLNVTSDGLTDIEKRVTQVKAHLNTSKKLRVTAHELGHALLHDGMAITALNLPVTEVETEVFTYQLLTNFGFGSDYEAELAQYIAVFESYPTYRLNPWTDTNRDRVLKALEDVSKELYEFATEKLKVDA